MYYKTGLLTKFTRFLQHHNGTECVSENRPADVNTTIKTAVTFTIVRDLSSQHDDKLPKLQKFYF